MADDLPDEDHEACPDYGDCDRRMIREEFLPLIEAYRTIENPEVRSAILELVKTYAKVSARS